MSQNDDQPPINLPRPPRKPRLRVPLPSRENVHYHTFAQWVVIVLLALWCPELRGPIQAIFGITIPGASAHGNHETTQEGKP